MIFKTHSSNRKNLVQTLFGTPDNSKFPHQFLIVEIAELIIYELIGYNRNFFPLFLNIDTYGEVADNYRRKFKGMRNGNMFTILEMWFSVFIIKQGFRFIARFFQQLPDT